MSQTKIMHVVSLLPVLFFLGIQAESNCFGFQRPNGAASDPGENGGVGTAGANIDWHATTAGVHSNHHFYAGHGGHGGHGGAGIDGIDPDTVAQGGNGGHGGDGGSINARMSVVPQSLWQYYYAGNGGSGGTGGTSFGLPNGSGASGGNGGSVALNLSAEEAIDAFGYGGHGGTGYGFGNQGGNGGDVSAEAHLVQANYTDVAVQRVVTTLVAGNGANGIARADGGSGGRVFLASGSQIESTADQHRFLFNLTGGNGGTSFGANGGAGGTATITAPDIVSIDPIPPGIRQGTTAFSAMGGNGGNSHLYYGSAARAGNGGHAILTTDANSRLDVYSMPNFKVDLVGGDGGSVTGTGHLLNGLNAIAGNGGDASLDNFSLISTKDSSPNRQFIKATGGKGGNNSFGRAGDGGDATLNSFHNESDLYYAQWLLKGGNGGDGQIAGNGGNASMVDALSLFLNDSTPQFYLRAAGGYAGLGNSTGGVGGNAVLKQTFQASTNLQVEGNAVAGLAANGTAGSASSDLTGIVNGSAMVTIFSGAQPDYIGNTPLSRTGSSVIAKANAQSDVGKANSRAVATGGRGWEKSGTADSSSVAHSQNGAAIARAESVSFGSSLAPPSMSSNFSNAKSLAAASGFSAVANSSSIAYGHFTTASSKGSIQGNSGTSTTHAETRTTLRFHRATSDLIVNIADNNQPVFTESRLAFRQSYQEDTSNHIRVASFLEGDASTLTGLQSGSLSSQYDFSAGAYNLLSTTEILTADAGVDFDFQGVLDVRQQLDSWEHESDYYAFFYDLDSIAGGVQDFNLRLFVNGSTVLDQTFATGDLAVSYLDDWSMLVAPSTSSNMHYGISYSGSSLNGQQFQLRMGIAGLNPTAGPMSFTAVPEPGSAGLGTIGLALLAVWRRRRA